MTKRRKLLSALALSAAVLGLAGCSSQIGADTAVVKEISLPNGGVVTCVFAGGQGSEASVSCDWEHVKNGE